MKRPIKSSRNRCFMLILYQDDPNYLEYINFITNKQFKTINFRYLGIEHNSDIDDNGLTKKSHDHIVLYFENARTIDSISKEMDLPIQYIEVYKSLKTALLYLLHYNQGDKAQYSIDDVYGDLKLELSKYLKNDVISEEDRVLKLLDLIDSYFKYTSYSTFLRDVCNLGLYDILRRNNYTFLKILDKKNEKFIDNT